MCIRDRYKTMILPMALNGAEAVSAMGVDSPLAVLLSLIHIYPDRYA